MFQNKYFYSKEFKVFVDNLDFILIEEISKKKNWQAKENSR